MSKPKYVFLFGLILIIFLDPISGRKGGGHSYPSSSGLSGAGRRSGGLSGGGHGYPSSGGSHGYPSSGGSHSYPSSGGSHSYPSSGNSGYPSSGGSHTYPSSGNKQHSYPSSGGGLSGTGRGYPANKPTGQHTTHVYNNYHYSPPAQITYASPRGGAPMSYPVYRGTPPTYVYQYKDSGSKYGTLLAGLALMNLGTLGVAAYAAHQANSNHGGSGSSGSYKPQPGEVCKFAVKKENGDYEETRIDCQIISAFILQDMQTHSSGNNATITTVTTVTNTTIVNNTNIVPTETTTAAPSNILYQMLPNGTLVPVNVTGVNIPGAVVNGTQNVSAPAAPNGSVSSSVVTTTTNTTQLVSALDVKGKPVEVTPGMQCFVIRTSPISTMRKAIPCGVLQTYAEKSIRKNSASRNMPIMFTVITAALAYCIAY